MDKLTIEKWRFKIGPLNSNGGMKRETIHFSGTCSDVKGCILNNRRGSCFALKGTLPRAMEVSLIHSRLRSFVCYFENGRLKEGKDMFFFTVYVV